MPVGRSLFSLGTKAQGQNGKVIFPDQELTNRLTTFLSSTFAITENGKEYISNGYKTQKEINEEKAYRTSQGILTANKFGLGLTFLILALSAFSLYNSNKSTRELNSTISKITQSSTKLETSLQNITNSFSTIETMTENLSDYNVAKEEALEKGNDKLVNSISSLNSSIKKVNTEIKDLESNAKELNTVLNEEVKKATNNR